MLETDIQKAREIFLGGAYGKFDGVEQLIPPEAILTARPRQLRRMIADLLGLSMDQVPNKTFMSWLYRYRSRPNHVNRPAAGLTVTRLQGGKDEQKGGGDWRSFEASDPKRLEEGEGDLISFPEYGKDS